MPKYESIHTMPIKWQDMGEFFVGNIKIRDYRISFSCGVGKRSLPGYKLNSANQYGEFEARVYHHDADSDDFELVRLDDVLPESVVENLKLTAAKYQVLHHRKCAELVYAVRAIAVGITPEAPRPKPIESIHELGLHWKLNDTKRNWYTWIKLCDRYDIFLIAGETVASMPQEKLNNPSGYAELEAIFYKDGKAVNLADLLSRVMLRDEVKGLCLTNGFEQHHLCHRLLIKICWVIRQIAAMEPDAVGQTLFLLHDLITQM